MSHLHGKMFHLRKSEKKNKKTHENTLICDKFCIPDFADVYHPSQDQREFRGSEIAFFLSINKRTIDQILKVVCVNRNR